MKGNNMLGIWVSVLLQQKHKRAIKDRRNAVAKPGTIIHQTVGLHEYKEV